LQIFLLVFQVLLLQNQDLLLLFSIRNFFLKLGLKFLALFALRIKFCVSILLLSLQSLRLFFYFALKFLTIHLDSIFIALDCPFKLGVQVTCFLLCELDLLLVESSLTLKVDLSLCELIFFLINLGLQLLITLQKIGSFFNGFVFHSEQLFIALCNLRYQRFLLVFKSSASSFLTSNLLSESVYLIGEFSSFRVEFPLKYLDLGSVSRLLSVESLFSVTEILLQRVDSLLSQADFAFKVRNHLFVLLNRMVQIALDHLHLVFVVVGLFTEFLLVLFYQLICSAGVTLFFVVEALLETLFFRLIELFELLQLFLGLRVDFLKLLLVQAFFFFKFLF